MRLWKRISELLVSHKLILANNAQIVQLDQSGKEQPFSGGGVEGLTATGLELNRTSDVSERLVDFAATTAVTIDDHDGRTILMGAAATEVSATLPAATGSGARFRFVIGANNSESYIIDAETNPSVFVGTIMTAKTDDSPFPSATPWVATVGDAFVKVDMNSTTTGGNPGDWIELEDIDTGIYQITGCTTSSGSIQSPFVGGL